MTDAETVRKTATILKRSSKRPNSFFVAVMVSMLTKWADRLDEGDGG